MLKLSFGKVLTIVALLLPGCARHAVAPVSPPVSEPMATAPAGASGEQVQSRHRNALLIRATTVTPAIARSVKLQRPQGVTVLEVIPGGVAAAAGLRAGDIILGFNAQPIGTMADMQRELRVIAAGSTIGAGVWRAGRIQQMQLTF